MTSRLLVVFPLHYQVSASWFANWMYMDKTPVAGCTISKGVYITDAMVRLTEEALKSPNWDRLVILEHDVLPPYGAFPRIAEYPDECAVVGSMVYTHLPPHNPYVFSKSTQPGVAYDTISPEAVAYSMTNPGLYECDAVGMGFTSIARGVLEDWDPNVFMWGPDRQFESHDLWFCYQAAHQGHRLYFDSAMQCAHMTEIPITGEHHRRSYPTLEGVVPDDSVLVTDIDVFSVDRSLA
jgi:hypothetical protein